MSEGQGIRFGIMTGQRDTWPVIVDRWQELETLGFDVGWVTDHFFGGADEMVPYFEAWTLLAGVAAVTEKIRMGIMVCSVTHRNPSFLAKQAITVDHISNGRCDFGLGAGWWEREHEAYSYEYPSDGVRVGMFREALEVFDSFQENERTDYDGEYYRFVNTPFEPKGIQPRMPVVVGASGPKMLAITAKHANIWNTRSEIDEAVRKSNLLDAACEKIGRDPATIMRSVWPAQNQLTSVETFRNYVETFYDAGFRDFMFGWPPDEAGEEIMREVARTVIPEFRERS